MNGKELLEGLGEIKLELYQEAENGKLPPAAARRPLRRPVLAAALIALMLLLTGCAVAYMLHMRDMKVGSEEGTSPVFNEYLELQGYEPYSLQILTIAGVKGTPGYQAAQEWLAFRNTYDPDGAIDNSLRGNYPEYPSKYDAYTPYSQEMVDKLDEISQKYDLRLLGPRFDIHGGKRFCREMGIDGILVPGSKAEVSVHGATGYEAGSFFISAFDMKMPEEEGQWPFYMLNSLFFCQKDCFNPFLIYLGDTSDWKEWNYTTASGQKVLLMMSPSAYKGWIVCDRPDSMITVSVPTRNEVFDGSVNAWVESPGMTERQFEQVADAFDFSMQPRYQGEDPIAADGIDPTATVQTQNGCTVTVKSVEADGYTARIVLGVTMPDGVLPAADGQMCIAHSGYDVLSPRADGMEGGSCSDQWVDDGDGLANTFDIQIQSQPAWKNGAAPFRASPVWDLYIDELVCQTWDEANLRWTETPLVEGPWIFEVNFEDSDLRELELAPSPITAKACVGWKPVGNGKYENVYEDVEISSFILRSLSATIVDNSDRADFTDGQQVFIVMKDGSRVELWGCSGQLYLTESPIDVTQVDHVLLGDGTKLPASALPSA